MKFIRYICISALLFLCGSCSDFLDNAPDDQLTLEMIFNDKVRTEDWLAYVYGGIPSPDWASVRFIGYETLADDVTPSQRWSQWWGDGTLNYRVGQWYTNSAWGSNFWSDLPKRIRSGYIFINNAHANPNLGVSEDDIEQMKNECRFLIAYYYWVMTEAYGSVPFFSDEANLDDELMNGQRSFDETVDWIDEQLKDLSVKLPSKRINNQYGRATSIMCLAVRARMLLFAASPLVNGNEWYKGFLNHDGKQRFNSTYDHNKWVKAATACEELINAAKSAGHDLYYEYNGDGTIDPFSSCANLFLKTINEGNKEILFARPNSPDIKTWEEYSTPRGCGGSGGLGVTQSLVDAFFMENGLPAIDGYKSNGEPIINKQSGYTEEGFSTQPEIRNTKWDICRNAPSVQDGQITLAGVYNMYSKREPRFYTTVTYNGEWWWTENRRTQFKSNEPDGGPTHDAPQNGYLLRKKVSLEQIPRDNKHPYRPAILYRLGEAYLNYAEALNEAYDTSDAREKALSYVNEIRKRAGIRQYTFDAVSDNDETYIHIDNNHDAVQKIIRMERRVELCAESIRYNDIRRWKLGEELLNANEYGMNFSGTKESYDKNDEEAFYVRTVCLKRIYAKKCYWFPIHQTEIDKDPTLRQAPFWM